MRSPDLLALYICEYKYNNAAQAACAHPHASTCMLESLLGEGTNLQTH